MIRYSLTFLSGAMVPAIALYLTGGSNRFNFIFGLILGVLLTVATLFSIRGRSYTPILSPHPHSDPRPQFPTQPAPPHRLSGGSRPMVVVGGMGADMVTDVTSALTNLGVSRPKAQRTVKDLIATKQYPNDERGMEELLGDAVRVVTAMNRRTA